MTKNSFRFQAPRFKFRVVVTAVELKQLEQAVPDFYAGSCLTRRTADSSSRNAVSFSSASQGSANYRRDARQQRRLFERQNPRLRRSPYSNRNREQLLVMSGEYGVNVPLRRGRAILGHILCANGEEN